MYNNQHFNVFVQKEGAMNKDRRINRSKKKIEDNIIKLLKTKSLNQITVKELCDMSDLNRGTFYNHYLDIYDLMAQIENNLIDEFELKLSKYSPELINKDSLPLFKEVLTFINQHADITTIFLREKEYSLFIEKIINLFKTRAIHTWGIKYTNSNIKNYGYFLEYAINGCLGIINKWLKDGCKDNPNNLALLLEGMVINGTYFLNKK